MKRILNIFQLPLNYLIKQEFKGRWIRVLRELEEFSYDEIESEYRDILDLVGSEPHHPLYYLEAVRRTLVIKRNNKSKQDNMPKAIKDLFK